MVPCGADGVRIEPIVLMSGAHHFNEVILDSVFVPDADVLGEVGNGWHQVTSELSFERSGPERILSTGPLLFAAVRALGHIGAGAKSALPELEKLRSDPEDYVRQAAAEALAAIK